MTLARAQYSSTPSLTYFLLRSCSSLLACKQCCSKGPEDDRLIYSLYTDNVVRTTPQ